MKTRHVAWLLDILKKKPWKQLEAAWKDTLKVYKISKFHAKDSSLRAMISEKEWVNTRNGVIVKQGPS